MFTAAAALQFIQIKMHKSGRRRIRIEEMTQGWQLNDDRGTAGGGPLKMFFILIYSAPLSINKMYSRYFTMLK